MESLKENLDEALKNNTVSPDTPDLPKQGLDVFISYSSLNKNVADAVVSDFEQNGIRCWYAPRDIMPGQEWVTAIHEAINACQLFVLIYTDSSNESKQVANEVALAFNSGKTLIPFKLSDTQMSSELEYYLTRVHWLDAVNPPLLESIANLRKYSKKILEGNVPKESKIRNSNNSLKKTVPTYLLYPVIAALVVLLIIAVVLLVNKDNNDTGQNTDITGPGEITDVPVSPTAITTEPVQPTETEDPDITEADKLYKKAYEIQNNSEKDSRYEEAYELYMQTGDSLTDDEDIINAINELAAFFYNDMSDEETKKKALDLYNKAAASGSINAHNFLGNYYLDIDRDPDELKYAASAYEGNGMTDALASAIAHYEYSAGKNDPVALYSLGFIYENSDGLNNLTHFEDNSSHDYEKALEYYKKAADAGHGLAANAYERVKKQLE
ncbi:MAG: toll/interleukin-1 receptor domain-containing protein [Lachnospiraceae bacterium]|nr:toll/interleukin-1 receptor domain-containing protein [Lachnospiraceae bacterium]MBR3580078.1 toll/interleukin-1 receptor domain-containing protein [Lachnospiraceae bacterium]